MNSPEMKVDRLADEVERLKKVNAELVEALENLFNLCKPAGGIYAWSMSQRMAMQTAYNLIARAKEVS